MKNKSYKTKQKEEILDIIKQQKNDFSIQDIYNELNHKVGLTTIYRYIDKLLNEKRLNKYISNNNTAYYQYLEKCEEENHFYLRCEKCKELIHIDCNCVNDLFKHIKNKHNFKANNENVIVNGICSKCK